MGYVVSMVCMLLVMMMLVFVMVVIPVAFTNRVMAFDSRRFWRMVNRVWPWLRMGSRWSVWRMADRWMDRPLRRMTDRYISWPLSGMTDGCVACSNRRMNGRCIACSNRKMAERRIRSRARRSRYTGNIADLWRSLHYRRARRSYLPAAQQCLSSQGCPSERRPGRYSASALVFILVWRWCDRRL